MTFKLEVGDENEENGLRVKLVEIGVKRLPLDPKTGLGDDELEVILQVKTGEKEEEIVFSKQYLNEKPQEKFEGYTITLLKGDTKSVELSVTAE